MTENEEAEIRERDAGGHQYLNRSERDRRVLLAEMDRLRGLLAEPSDAMVEAALREWFRAGRQENREAWGFGPEMRAALVAAGRAMAKS